MIFLYRPVLNYHQIFTQYCVLTPQIEMLPAAFVNVQYASIMTSFRPTNLSTTPRKYTSHATLHLNVLLQKYGLALQAISSPYMALSLSLSSFCRSRPHLPHHRSLSWGRSVRKCQSLYGYLRACQDRQRFLSQSQDSSCALGMRGR